MLTEKILNYLEENEGKLLSEFQERNRKFLADSGFDQKSSFFQFMSMYSDEMLGTEGHISDVVDDLMDYSETSYNYQIHIHGKIPTNYISLTDNITELFLLYDKSTDKVVLVEDGNRSNLLNGIFDRQWDSFNDFLTEFFGL